MILKSKTVIPYVEYMRLKYMHRKRLNHFKLPDISAFQVSELFSMASLAISEV
jgi:hypothetical protein